MGLIFDLYYYMNIENKLYYERKNFTEIYEILYEIYGNLYKNIRRKLNASSDEKQNFFI